MTYADYFQQVTGHPAPRPWQTTLAESEACTNRLIRIPTGLGKTEGILGAWSFHRLHRKDDNWPRRLVWCLPMRVLVEQTFEVVQQLLSKVDKSIQVHMAMGGESGSDWYLYPEQPAVIIGTMDMLLSRALNRGFASARARWPLEFGLLHQDALWIMDEVQLMDVGLATSAQLQAFRDQDQKKSLRPCHSWWMSATLQPDWLLSVDTKPHHGSWVSCPIAVPQNDRHGGLWDIPKALQTIQLDATKDRAFAQMVLDEHQLLVDGEFGKITLVVCNTVERACQTYDALRQAGRKSGLELIHSRFRPHERQRWRESFLSRSACSPGVDRIIVATQVVEAGVDISAGCLVTENAPWPSLVQRFGRCARYGGTGRILVVDRGRDKVKSAPYQAEELESAWEALTQLQTDGAGIAALERFEEALPEDTRGQLYPYAPDQLLLRKEFEELFDTTPDLSGADLDISRFIRSDEQERDLQVFWVPLEKASKPTPVTKPERSELCTVPFLRARDWLCEAKKSRLKSSKRAWVWDWLDGEWKAATRDLLLPGRVVCVATDSGGYLTDRGFTADSPLPVPQVPQVLPTSPFDQADDQLEGDQVSYNPWKTIACHTQEVLEEVRAVSSRLSLPTRLHQLLELAACWHDWGKAHLNFQGSIRHSEDGSALRPARLDLAKAPKNCWPKKHLYELADNSDRRPGFRHELASALGLFAILEKYAPVHPALLGPWLDLFAAPAEVVGLKPSPLEQQLLDCSAEDFDLVAYLVASHHGKVRLALQASPKDQDYQSDDGNGLPIRGVRDGDLLPGVSLLPGLEPVQSVTLRLSLATVGLSSTTGISWRERCLALQNLYGPAALAFLEALLCASDRKASQKLTNDPLMKLVEH